MLSSTRVELINDSANEGSVIAFNYWARPEAERFQRETCVEVAHETGLRAAAPPIGRRA